MNDKMKLIEILREFMEEPDGSLKACVSQDPQGTAERIGDEIVKRFPDLLGGTRPVQRL